MDGILEWFVPLLVAITLVLAVGAVVASCYIVWVYRGRAVNDREQRRQARFAIAAGVVAVVIAALAAWALLRTVFPHLELAGLPAPWTTVVILLGINLLLLWPINTARTWRRWRRGDPGS